LGFLPNKGKNQNVIISQGDQVQGAGDGGNHRPLKITLHLQRPALGQNGYNYHCSSIWLSRFFCLD